jgi:aldose 1-epimerase
MAFWTARLVDSLALGCPLTTRETTTGAHLYTGNWLDGAHAKGGESHGVRAGFAFEPEFYPDCAHHLS